MAPRTLSLAAGLVSLLAVANAQTYTDCNPLKRDNCPADPALGTNATFNWKGTAADDDVWTADAGQVDFTPESGDFVINGQGDSVTLISKFYIFFGKVSVMMKAAQGQGIVTSIVMESDDLDEVDWELIGGNETHVETNYFGKGNTTSYDRAIWYPIDNPMEQFHNYTTTWTKDQIDWYVDDKHMRTLAYGDALEGKNYPQTPMTIRLGIWAGGDTENNKPGVVQWAGGPVNWDQAPFTMSVQGLYVEDYSTGKEYRYTDNSGSFESIKAVEPDSKSDVTQAIEDPEGVEENWDALSKPAQIAIIACVSGVAVIGAAIIAFCCVKQRKAGRVEHARLQEEYARERNESSTYRKMMQEGNFGHGNNV